MKNKVLVFGGSGFVGKYIVNELIKRKYNVLVADINQADSEHNYIHCDITKREDVLSLLNHDSFNFIYNLAGFANLDASSKHPYDTFQLNVLGNINILDAVCSIKCERFIYASSAYAMSNKGSFYGLSKLASEKLIEEYSMIYNLNYSILRYGSIYSELPFSNNYIYTVIEKAIKEKVIIHGGDGEELREYIHASDAAKLSVDIIESSQFINQIVVLTGSEKMRRIDLFLMIKEMLNDDVEIILETGNYNHHYRFTPYSFTPTFSRKLSANPHIDIGQGILECIKNAYKYNAGIEEYR
ncbi:MAG: NAD-dependent epimerase/dehydratase family protein [Bacteroidota bacterium]